VVCQYCKLWCRLDALSPHDGTLIALCRLFEDVLALLAPRLIDHMTSVGCSPLDIAFPWLKSAFSTYLEIPQLLLLWDRVVGYDSLDVLALLAVAILVFRYNSITSADTADLIRCGPFVCVYVCVWGRVCRAVVEGFW
jgi:hypothetical protein